jgi:inner membrane protein
LDFITHSLLGLTAYGAKNKETLTKSQKRALLFTAVSGSVIPDIDVVARFTEIGRIMDLMWHRGITHSVIMIPIWALFLYLLSYLFWKEKNPAIFFIGLFSVSVHIFTDSLNTWGTGLLEPFSAQRFSIGTVSIIDFVLWSIFIIGLVSSILIKKVDSHKIYKLVWFVISIHIIIQSAIGLYFFNMHSPDYEQTSLKANFIPWEFTIIGKNENEVKLIEVSLWQGSKSVITLISSDHVDLSELFEKNPKAKVLMDWAPFVVVVDNEEQLGIYDPRFYIHGKSFLYEYIKKSK